MFDRETRRAKVLEARGRAKRDNRAKSAGEVGLFSSIVQEYSLNYFIERRKGWCRRWPR